MKTNRIGWICALALVLVTTTTIAQEEPADPMADAMAAMAELAAPNEHHAHMEKMVGSWKAEGTYWMQPGAPPVTSSGTAKIEPTLGGRFLKTSFEGAMMGQTFHGFGMEGYDKLREKHIGVWADDWGTMMMHFEGDCAEGGKVTTVVSDFLDPMTRTPTRMKAVTTLVNKKEFKWEAYMKPEGADDYFKSMEIVYKRD